MNLILLFTVQCLFAVIAVIPSSNGVFVKGRRRSFNQQLRAQQQSPGQPRALFNHHNDRQKISTDRNSNTNNNADLVNAEDPGTLAAEDLSPGLGLPFNSFNNTTKVTNELALTNSSSIIYEDFSPLLSSSGNNINNNIHRPIPNEPLHVLRAELVRVDEQIQQLRSRDNNVGKMFQLLQLLSKREELQDKIAIKTQAEGSNLTENA